MGYSILTGILLLFYAHLESRWIKTQHIEIQSNEIPASFHSKKIVFITDIHHGPFFSARRVAKLVKRINKLKPDFIVLGGDYVHRESKYIKPFFHEINNLKTKQGVYAVLGNHDHWEDAKLSKELMLKNGINLCNNNAYWVKIETDSIKIGGVGDLWEDTQILDSTIYDVKETDFVVLISHNPDYIEEMDTDLVDLTLSGHTHGGQVTLFGLWAPILPSRYGQKYRYGLHDFDKTTAYISSGIGTITPPVRFFCRPEVVLLELKNQ